MAALGQLQREVDVRLGSGEPLSHIEDALINPSDLSEERKAMLWLYGWACLENGRRRYQPPAGDIRNQRAGRPLVLSGD
jgi:hypothetical protein